MITLLVLGLILLAALVASWLALHGAGQSRSEARVRRALLEADAELQAEHRQARRAMNDAAGQSWRNLTE